MLAVAYAEVETRPSYSVADETGLTLAGFLTFSDPPLEDAAETLAKLRHDGVEVKIITGDGDLVTASCLRKVGLESGRIVLGDDLAQMTDTALGQVAENTTVFARVSPPRRTASCWR